MKSSAKMNFLIADGSLGLSKFERGKTARVDDAEKLMGVDDGVGAAEISRVQLVAVKDHVESTPDESVNPAANGHPTVARPCPASRP